MEINKNIIKLMHMQKIIFSIIGQIFRGVDSESWTAYKTTKMSNSILNHCTAKQSSQILRHLGTASNPIPNRKLQSRGGTARSYSYYCLCAWTLVCQLACLNMATTTLRRWPTTRSLHAYSQTRARVLHCIFAFAGTDSTCSLVTTHYSTTHV